MINRLDVVQVSVRRTPLETQRKPNRIIKAGNIKIIISNQRKEHGRKIFSANIV